MSTWTARVGASGRVVIPVELRARLGIREGEDLTFTETEHGTMIESRQQRIQAGIERLRKVLVHIPGALDDFLAERRAEAAKELADD